MHPDGWPEVEIIHRQTASGGNHMPMRQKKPADPLTECGFGPVNGHGIVVLRGTPQWTFRVSLARFSGYNCHRRRRMF